MTRVPASRLQRQRFEYKYIIREQVALGVRDYVRSYLRLDEFGATRSDCSYPVHTLYLDSPDLALYRSTINGDRNRFKLRIRFYEGAESSPVYLEIKRRANAIILKKRAAVSRASVASVLAGHLPSQNWLLDQDPASIEALETFAQLTNRLSAVPQVHVSYVREAWMDDGANAVRVTMDRAVGAERRSKLSFEPKLSKEVQIFGDQVVLELKFTDRFPRWFSDMVRTFGIRSGSAAKYADGVVRLGNSGIMSAYV